VASNEAVYGPPAPGSRREALASANPRYRFLSPHQAAVLAVATHRLAPGPVHEAHVVAYVDRLLWLCVADLPDQYLSGIALLDRHAGGDFTSVPPLHQDLILCQGQLVSFTGLLFTHTIDAMYAVPRQVNRLDDSPPSGIAMAYFSGQTLRSR
jgi:hypothetical protein